MPKKVLFRKILVVKPSSLGDVVHSLPFLNAISACFPKAKIHWVVAKGLEGLLEGNPMIDRLLVINKDLWKQVSKAGSTVKEIRQLYRGLRDEKYDLVVDLQGLLRSGLITMATRAPVRIGFAEAREGSRFFYTMKVKGGKGVHAVERYLKITSELGCDADDIVFPFPLSAGGSAGDKDNSYPDDYAVLVPGARWKTKIWPAENFGEVAARLPVRSIVIGSSADRGIAGQVVASSAGKALSVAGKTTLAELIGIIRNARLVITNDSGPMHIAAALNIPVIALFGPTSPVLTGPYGKGHIVLQTSEPCAPCFRRQCKDIICMKGISPSAVLDEAMKVLKAGRA